MIVGLEICDEGPNPVGCSNCERPIDGFECNSGNCTSICGDGLIVDNEACDDGNTVSGDGCSEDCLTIEPNFECYFDEESESDQLICINYRD